MQRLDIPDPNQLSALTPWQLDFRQIEAGPMRTSIVVKGGGPLQLVNITMSHAVHQTGLSPPGSLTFGLPSANALSRWHGAELPAAPLVVFGSSAEFDGVSRAAFQAVTFSVQEASLESAADRLGIALPEHVLQAGVLVQGGSHSNHKLMRMSAALLLTRAARIDEADADAFALSLLVRLTESEFHADKSAPRKRDQAFRRAVEFMEASTDANTPISEICHHSGASWRTLERAFVERFGIGPKAYYKQLRLLRARALILQGGPALLVADAANRFGFWHMGAFASDYRRLFGSLPSEDAGLVAASAIRQRKPGTAPP